MCDEEPQVTRELNGLKEKGKSIVEACEKSTPRKMVHKAENGHKELSF